MKKLLLIIIFILIYNDTFAQAPADELTYRQWISTNDTLIIKRKNGDWWFGGRIGLNRNYYFGTLEYLTNNDPGNPFKRLIKFDVGDGGGMIFGGQIEYLPVYKKWGYGINIDVIEGREVNASSNPLNDSLFTFYDFNSKLNYLVASPYARLNLIFDNLFIYSGLDIALNVGQNTTFRKNFQNSGKIEQWQKDTLSNLPVSIGFHIGLGYDLFLADISEKARTRLTPFISLGLNSSVIGDNNSTWSAVQLKMGFAVKIGFDNIEYDTLFYDKDFVPPPEYMASINKGNGVEFEGFRFNREIVAADLKIVPIPEIVVATKKEPELALNNPKIEEQESITKFNLANPYLFSFAASSSTELNNELKQEIKKMSQFLKANPRIRVSITGFSDNAGTFTENDRRSRLRAEKAYQEFIKNGIKTNQLAPPSWKGSISPIANNDTEEGRRKNRRVEIVFIR